MSLPARHAITEAKIFRMRNHARNVMDRAFRRGLSKGAYQRKAKRSDRIAMRWTMMHFKLSRIDPHEQAIPGVMPVPSACWDKAA